VAEAVALVGLIQVKSQQLEAKLVDLVLSLLKNLQ
jgi:hypothetical protein